MRLLIGVLAVTAGCTEPIAIDWCRQAASCRGQGDCRTGCICKNKGCVQDGRSIQVEILTQTFNPALHKTPGKP